MQGCVCGGWHNYGRLHDGDSICAPVGITRPKSSASADEDRGQRSGICGALRRSALCVGATGPRTGRHALLLRTWGNHGDRDPPREKLEAVPYSLSVVSGDELARTGVTDIRLARQPSAGLDLLRFRRPPESARRYPSSAASMRAISRYRAELFALLNKARSAPISATPRSTATCSSTTFSASRCCAVPRAPCTGPARSAGRCGSSPTLRSSACSREASTRAPVFVEGANHHGLHHERHRQHPDRRHLWRFAPRPNSPTSRDASTSMGFSSAPARRSNAIPVLADPTDPVNSPGIYYGKNDWNDQNSFTGRAALTVETQRQVQRGPRLHLRKHERRRRPSGEFDLSGRPVPARPANHVPARERPADVQRPRSAILAQDHPLERRFELRCGIRDALLDEHLRHDDRVHDGGWDVRHRPHQLSSTSITTTRAIPLNPRYVEPGLFTDTAHTFDQELRLVSKTEPGREDRLCGRPVLRESDARGILVRDESRLPRTRRPAGLHRAVLRRFEISRTACSPSARYRPDANFVQIDTQDFTDKSEFGELTWHFMPNTARSPSAAGISSSSSPTRSRTWSIPTTR